MGTHFYKNTNTRGTALQFPIFQYLTHSLSMVRRPFVRWPRSDWDVSYKWNSVYDINLGVLLMKRKFCPKLGPFFLSLICPLVRFFRFFCQLVCSWLTTIWWSDAVFLYWWRKLVHLNWPIYTQFGSKFGSGTFCDLVRCFWLFGRSFVRFLTYSAVFLSVCHFVCLWHYLLNRVVNPGKHDGNALQILHAFLC